LHHPLTGPTSSCTREYALGVYSAYLLIQPSLQHFYMHALPLFMPPLLHQRRLRPFNPAVLHQQSVLMSARFTVPYVLHQYCHSLSVSHTIYCITQSIASLLQYAFPAPSLRSLLCVYCTILGRDPFSHSHTTAPPAVYPGLCTASHLVTL
jgi:hypothetical protein